MQWFLSRLKEPSTWAGFAGLIPAIITVAAGPVSPAAIGGLVAGVAAVLMPEKARAE